MRPGGEAAAPDPLLPAERTLYDRLQALPPAEKRRLIAEVSRISRQRKFYYLEKDHHPVGLVPMVLDRRLLPVFEGLTRSIFRFQMRAPALHRSNHRGFADIVRLERRTSAWLDATGARTPKPWELIIRPDYSMREVDGAPSPVLFEFNSLMLGGLHIQSVALHIVRTVILPALGAARGVKGLEASADLMPFLRRWLLESRRRAGFAGNGGIAFLEQLPPGGGFSELPCITEFFRASGIEARHGDPRELELKEGRVTLRGMPVAYAYRDFSYEDLGGPESPRLRAFKRLWTEGRVTPGFPADFDQKGILECLTSEEFAGLFTRDEARRLKKHVPWTRVLAARRASSPQGRRVDLPEHVRRSRETLVIKPSWGAGGEGILIGRKTKAARWEAAVEAAVRKPGAFAVQAYVDAPPRPSAYLRGGEILFKDCHYTLGNFHEGKAFGFHYRVSPKDIVNVAQGGALGPLYFA